VGIRDNGHAEIMDEEEEALDLTLGSKSRDEDY